MNTPNDRRKGKTTGPGDDEHAKHIDIHFFKTGSAIHKVDLSTIDYITAFGNYSKLIMSERQLTISMPLKDIEKHLNPKDFIRIHRSCIVAIKKIEKIKDHVAYINNEMLPIGKLYRDEFYNSILNF